MTRPTITPAPTGDDRTARIAAAADRLLGHVASVGLGSDDVSDAETVSDFLLHLAAADEVLCGCPLDDEDSGHTDACRRQRGITRSPAPDGELDALSMVALTVVQSLVRAGFEVSANVDDLDRAFRGLADVLTVLGVAVDPDVDPVPGVWLRCVRAAAVLAVRR